MRLFLLLACFLPTLLFSQPDDLRLADGSPFPLWEDSTTYQRTWYVNPGHPEARDTNPGSREQPLATISAAAARVQPGERVEIAAGLYREAIRLARGGNSAREMIAFEAAPGAEVLIRGSRVFEGDWSPSQAKNGRIRSLRLWQAELPAAFFAGGDNPFAQLNASAADIALMPWAEDWKGEVPYTLTRGLVFQNGQRLTQLAHYDDLYLVPGSFWVDTLQQRLHLHPLLGLPPAEAEIELTVHQQLFVPEPTGAAYVRLRGLTFEHAGNGFPRVGTGAVFVKGGHHWIIERCTVRHVNSVGIETGARKEESKVSDAAEQARVKAHPGGFILRQNHVYDCGTGGLQGHNVSYSLFEGNHLHHIGWQDAEYYWECAAIKLLVNEGTLLRYNRIHDVEAACGIWLDWNNKNCRITRNLIYDIRPADGGALYVEASQVPNRIDHNVLWNVDRLAISLYDSDEVTVAYNLIGRAGTPWSARVNTDRSLNGRPFTSRRHQIHHNLVYLPDSLPVVEHKENVVNHNLFVGGDWGAWQAAGWDAGGARVGDLRLDFDRVSGRLLIEAPAGWPALGDEPAGRDYFLQPRAAGAQAPGPFGGKRQGQLGLDLGEP